MAGDGGLQRPYPQTEGGLRINRFFSLANDFHIDGSKTQGLEHGGHGSIGGQEDTKEGRNLKGISLDEKLLRGDPFSEGSADRCDHGRIIRERSKTCQEQPLRREKCLTR